MNDQTDLSWVKPDITGTGIFLFERNPRPADKVLMPGITYQQCLERGASALAFKWVPTHIADYATLAGTQCGERCVRTCTKPGCICNPATGQCV